TAARLEVQGALLIRIAGAALADLLKSDRRGIEHHKAIHRLARRAVPVVSQSDLESEVWLDFVIVLHEAADRVYVDPAGAIRRIGGESIRLIRDECIHRGECEGSRSEREIVVVDSPVFAADLNRVLSADPAQGVR